MAKRKETVTVRAKGWACVTAKGMFHYADKKQKTAEHYAVGSCVVVPCTITYTKPGGKNGK